MGSFSRSAVSIYLELPSTRVRNFCIAVLLVAVAIGTPLPKADRIVVHKKDRTMELMHAGRVIKTYKVALGANPVGPKTQQGDHKTPEGVYVIDRRNPSSKFHRALHISYPSAADREQARKCDVSPGGDVFVHGLPNGYGFLGAAHRARDWTGGCIAVTDEEIEEIWKLVDNGTPIEIRP